MSDDIPVDVTDESTDGATPDADPVEAPDMDVQLAEAIDLLSDARADPNSVLACGVIIAFTDETEVTNDDGEQADGVVWRVINPTAHRQYDEITDVLADVEYFDENVTEMRIVPDDDASGADGGLVGLDLADLLG